MGKIIGIDLGTTNSCVAVMEGGRAVIVPTPHGKRTMPSVIAFSAKNERFVGTLAQRQAATNATGTIFGVKRLVGRSLTQPEVQTWAKAVPYEIVSAKNGTANVRVHDQSYSPQELLAMLLVALRENAEAYLGEAIAGAVITVPAYFDDNQRQAVRDAALIARLDVKNILNEPTAAALGYGLDKSQNRTLVVCDLGGGTFDVSVLRITDGVFQVLGTCGDTFLGGNDFDRCLFDEAAEAFERQTGTSITGDATARQRLLEATEAAKRDLSDQPSAKLSLPFIAQSKRGALHLEQSLQRDAFEARASHLLAALEAPCLQAVRDAKLEMSDIEQVLLVGGMTRMPAVQRKLESIFGRPAAKNVNPDEIVAIGAATQAGVLSGDIQDVILLDVTPHSLGVRVLGDRMSVVIDRNTTIPTVGHKIFATTQDGQDRVDVDVYQGDGELVRDNRALGHLSLTNIPRKRAAEVQVEVTFAIDVDGLLSITAVDMLTRQKTQVELRSFGALTSAEVHRLTKKHATLTAS